MPVSPVLSPGIRRSWLPESPWKGLPGFHPRRTFQVGLLPDQVGLLWTGLGSKARAPSPRLRSRREAEDRQDTGPQHRNGVHKTQTTSVMPQTSTSPHSWVLITSLGSQCPKFCPWCSWTGRSTAPPRTRDALGPGSCMVAQQEAWLNIWGSRHTLRVWLWMERLGYMGKMKSLQLVPAVWEPRDKARYRTTSCALAILRPERGPVVQESQSWDGERGPSELLALVGDTVVQVQPSGPWAPAQISELSFARPRFQISDS